VEWASLRLVHGIYSPTTYVCPMILYFTPKGGGK
jgi:hypothetical protein